ncbi:MAG: HD domain-containing protein [Thermoplasmata archaeon]|nr:HD domain-containing protein [Thermoplasmata archaeon]
MIPVKELKEGDSITTRYAVRGKESPRDYRNREGKYFFLTVGDRTGDIVLKYWGGSDPDRTLEVYNSISVGDVLEITGDVEYDRFSEKLVIRVNEDTHHIRVCGPDEYSPEEFLPVSEKDLDALYTTLLKRALDIKDEDLRWLVLSFLEDSEISGMLREAPGSAFYHYNFLGGTLEHTVNVVALCDAMCDSHEQLDRDLLVTGAILHDIGKTRGYRYSVSIEPTDEGRFLGHPSLGYVMVKERISSREGFPSEKAMKLYHLILTHHGDAEKGSTRRFKTPEACALHHAVQADEMTQSFLQAVEEGEGDKEDWVYSRSLGHEIYRGGD